ncbi:MAG TPA: hypothetical protein VKU41_28695 [Polyangiaceae bacterium]|nr:hypothetical protein [Polyangiaceae bacterium]
MIERYFQKGARFRTGLLGPASSGKGGRQPADGTIVVTPPAPPGSMIYVGIDRRLVPPPTPVFAFGANTRIDYSWLAFVEGRTTKISARGDVLTGPMSGCWITVWTDAAGRWVGHVGTCDKVDANESVKGTFATSMPRNVIGYQPDKEWRADEIKGMRDSFGTMPSYAIVALVTSNNQLFSTLFFREQREPDILICGGVKTANGTQYQGLFDAMMPKRRRADAAEPLSPTRPRR